MNNRKVIPFGDYTSVPPMQRAVKRGPKPMPEAAFNASQNTSLNAEDVTFICPICGVTPPIQVYIGQSERIGFLRGECDCMYNARQQRGRDAAMDEDRITNWHKTASRTYSWLGIDQPVLALMNFEQFNPDAQPAQYRDAVIAAYEFARGYASMCVASVVGQPNLLFQGPYGTGKTHIACSILNQLRAVGVRCLFTTAQDLFDSLYAAPFEEKPAILRQASDTPLLVIDDLDKLHVNAETDGAFQKRTLFDILDRRDKGRRPTIITTNKEDLSPWLDGATMSRLYGNFQPVIMNGVDYRLLKRQLRLSK